MKSSIIFLLGQSHSTGQITKGSHAQAKTGLRNILSTEISPYSLTSLMVPVCYYLGVLAVLMRLFECLLVITEDWDLVANIGRKR